MSVGAIGAEVLGGGGIHTPPPWYTSLKHPMALGVNHFSYYLWLMCYIAYKMTEEAKAEIVIEGRDVGREESPILRPCQFSLQYPSSHG